MAKSKRPAKSKASARPPKKQTPRGGKRQGALARSERQADERLVERTIDLLAEHDRTSARSARQVGAHVLASYFGGDVDLARSNDPTKAKSYARLVARAAEETEWSVSALRRAVRAEIAARGLPSDLATDIDATYLARLLAVDDPTKRVAVARQLASGQVRGQAAKDLIAEASGENRRGGRPRLTGVQRIAGAVENAFEDADEAGTLDDADLARVPDAARAAIIRRLCDLSDRLRDLAARLTRPS